MRCMCYGCIQECAEDFLRRGVAWSVNSPSGKTKWEDLRRTKRYDIMSAGRDVIARKQDPLRNRITGYRGRKWHEDRCELRALSWDTRAPRATGSSGVWVWHACATGRPLGNRTTDLWELRLSWGTHAARATGSSGVWVWRA